jgi:hypothetical protein
MYAWLALVRYAETLFFVFSKIETVDMNLVLICIVRKKKFVKKIIHDCEIYQFIVSTGAK